MILGIDASNLIEGGGVTHLVELVSAAYPPNFGIKQVHVWGLRETVSLLPKRDWLFTAEPPALRRGKLARAAWQRFGLKAELEQKRCDLLFVPGGSYVGRFTPYVTMSRNMLPFDPLEIGRYGISLKRVRLEILRKSQGLSFRRADGLIFLTDFARTSVLSSIGDCRGEVVTIPHGVNANFSVSGRSFHCIDRHSEANPFRLIYISHASPYKHQWVVIEAVARLRRATGWPLRLDMVGPRSVNASVSRIQDAILEFDPMGDWAFYHGPQPKDEIRRFLGQADLGVFASSCENMPNVLLEKMAAGLPLVCSDRGPMPEVLGSSGWYFDPESVDGICQVVEKAIGSPDVREQCSLIGAKRAGEFTWRRCADDTFSFLRLVFETRSKNGVVEGTL